MKSFTTLIHRYQAVILLAILAFAFFTRAVRLNVPEEYYFDEVYHAVTAKLIARNDPRAFEWWNPDPEPNTAVDWLHPPIAKYTQAVSIRIFGENSFGWRFSSVIFGVLVILTTYWLARDISGSIPVALLSAFLAALDGLILVQSRIAMNDIHVTFFILLTLFVYRRSRVHNSRKLFLLAVTCSGLALATKWSGLFVIILMLGYELVSTIVGCAAYKKSHNTQQFLFRQFLLLLSKIILLITVPLAIYIASYGQAFLQGKGIDHIIALHKQIFYYQFHLEATHPAESRPWQWFLNTHPVWQYVNYSNTTSDAVFFPSTKLRADIYALGNPLLFWIGDVSLLILFLQVARKILIRKSISALRFCITEPNVYLLSAYAIVWMPWIFSPRIMFFYHYAPAVPLLCIILALQLRSLWKKNPPLVVGLVTAIFAVFIIFFPHWTGIPLPQSFVEHFYFAFSDL